METYQEFILKALETSKVKLSKFQMQFAYIVYINFDIKISEAVEIALEK